MIPQRMFFVLLTGVALGGCNNATPDSIQGYVEGEFVMLGAPAAGSLEKLYVQRGQQVARGAPVFKLDHMSEQAAKREASQRLRNAEERLANLRAARRPPEIEAAAAQAAQAKAARALSTLQLSQQERLFKAGFISRAQLDAARANFERDIARVIEVEARIRLANDSIGRQAEIRAAAADAEAARAALDQADWRLAQRGVAAPVAALVQDTFFLDGEWVPAGRPVASLLPPGNVKVRFFVPERAVAALRQGDKVSVACDGCPAPVPASISFISRQAEFTPPVIYSKDSRAKLVFMVEARPSALDALKLRPGQPVDVTLAGR